MFSSFHLKSICFCLIFFAVILAAACSGGVQSDVYTVSGKVTLCSCGTDSVKVILDSDEFGKIETYTDPDGNFVFNKVWSGRFTVTPVKEGYTFSPETRTFSVSDDVELVDFDTITSWESTYGDIDKDGEAFSVVQTPDCGYVIAGYKDTSTGGTANPDMWIMKTDQYGNVVWEDTQGDENYPDFAYSAIYDSDYNYIVVAGYSDLIEAGAINILKYLPVSEDYLSWTLVGGWSRYFGSVLLQDKPQYILQTSGSGYFTGGYSGGTAGNLEDIYGVKVNSDGLEPVSLLFGIENAEISFAADSIRRDPGFGAGFIIAGESKGSDDSTKGLLLKREEGELSRGWSKYYTAKVPVTLDEYFSTSFSSVKETNDGGYICAGTVKLTSISTGDIYILKTDIDGNEVWNLIIDGGSDDSDVRVVITSDGGYAVAASCKSLTGSDKNYRLIKLSAEGVIEWQREFDSGEENDDSLRSLIQTYDGGFTLCGTRITRYNKRQPFVIKTDKYGELPLKGKSP